MPETWDGEFKSLQSSRSLYHNEDYWRFLVRDVWRIEHPPCRVIDFGCGYGWVGLFLMPLLASGSTYTGVDLSTALLERARAHPHLRGSHFVQCDASQTPFQDNQFDVAIAHTLMMHLSAPQQALREMIRVTRPGGLVVTADASRNAINALAHVHETDEQDHAPLALFQSMNAQIRRRTGVDYNIGMKMPVLMRQAGLWNVQARVSDAVRTSFPPLDTPMKEQLFKAICDDGLGAYPADDQGFAAAVDRLISRGVSARDASAELRREMHNDYRRRGRNYHIVQPGLITFSFGTVGDGSQEQP